jgi:hypothetical protein
MPCGVGRQDEIILVLDDRVLSVAHGSAATYLVLSLYCSLSPLPLFHAHEWGLLICHLWPLCRQCSDMSLCSRL